MSSYLSPILSSDNSSPTNSEYAPIMTQANEERRRQMLARNNQCRTPSSAGSEADEFDDDFNNDGNQLRRDSRQQLQPPMQHYEANNNNNKQQTTNGSAKLFQSLLANGYQHQQTGRLRLKQMVKSVPLPLLATSIIVVFIVCFVLSECQSFQASSSSSSSSSPDSSGGQLFRLEAAAMRRERSDDSIDESPEAVDHSMGDFQHHKQRQSALRRALELSQQQQHRRHADAAKRQASKATSGESDASSESAQDLDSSFGAMLFNALSSEQLTDQSVPAETVHFVQPEERPAHLRASPLELELGEPRAQPVNGLPAPVAAAAANTAQRRRQQQQQQQQQHPFNHQHHHREPEPANPNNRLQQQQAPTTAPTQHAHQQHRNNHDRPFDVAQIQCNNTEEGFERFACPSPDFYGRFRCIEDRLFCDGYYDCPGGEDEERVSCMYYKLFVSHIDILTNTFLTWMRKQNRQQQQQQQAHVFDVNGVINDAAK